MTLKEISPAMQVLKGYIEKRQTIDFRNVNSVENAFKEYSKWMLTYPHLGTFIWTDLTRILPIKFWNEDLFKRYTFQDTPEENLLEGFRISVSLLKNRERVAVPQPDQEILIEMRSAHRLFVKAIQKKLKITEIGHAFLDSLFHQNFIKDLAHLEGGLSPIPIQNAAPRPFLQLPNINIAGVEIITDIWIHILEYLPYESLLNFERVARHYTHLTDKRWGNLKRELWGEVEFADLNHKQQFRVMKALESYLNGRKEFTQDQLQKEYNRYAEVMQIYPLLGRYIWADLTQKGGQLVSNYKDVVNPANPLLGDLLLQGIWKGALLPPQPSLESENEVFQLLSNVKNGNVKNV